MRVVGYVTSRSFQGFTVPVPAQNSCLREFANSQGMIYVLPPLEHFFEECYMQLFTALKLIKKGDILAMYSVAMLPRSQRKLDIILNHLVEKKAKMHFILEGKTIKDLEEVKLLIFSYSLRSIFDDMLQIDLSSLRKLSYAKKL